MREKLLVLMKNEGLTSSRLAELLGIQPSGISHILAGRNKPSFDFVQKVLRRFPRINPDWLLLDSEQMYRTLGEEKSQTSENTIFSTDSTDDADNAKIEAAENSNPQPSKSTSDERLATMARSSEQRGGIRRIIVLFEDHSFESYDVGK